MKCWECKKSVTSAVRVCYIDDAGNERFRDICDECETKLKRDVCNFVQVQKITQTSLKKEIKNKNKQQFTRPCARRSADGAKSGTADDNKETAELKIDN